MVSQTVSQPKEAIFSGSLAGVIFEPLKVEITHSRMRLFSQQQKVTAAKTKLKALTMTQLLKYEDVQERLRLSRSTVIRLIEQGLLERIYVLGAPRITDTEVERFITNQTRTNRRKQAGL